MLIIPSIDILDGKIVRLAQGDFGRVTYYDFEPVERAKLFESCGFKLLHFVDLLGSKNGKITSLKTIDEIKKNTSLHLQFGGGIRNYEHVKILSEQGINRIVIGSMALTNKNDFEKVIADFGPDLIVAAADAMNGRVRIKGWTEESGVLLTDHIEYFRSLGVNNFLCTDISQDGMMEGPSVSLYNDLMREFPGINLIASGGITSMNNIKELEELDIYAAVIGRAIYENKLDIKELAKFGK